jgi:hypothetical protein
MREVAVAQAPQLVALVVLAEVETEAEQAHRQQMELSTLVVEQEEMA